MRGLVEGSRQSGLSQRDIAALMGVSKSTVWAHSRSKPRDEKDPSSPRVKLTQPGEPVTPEKERKKRVREVDTHVAERREALREFIEEKDFKFASGAKVNQAFIKKYPKFRCCTKTTQTDLAELGFTQRERPCMPAITKDNEDDRLAFAKHWLAKKDFDPLTFAFSDEC